MSDYSVADLHDACDAWAYQVGQMQTAYKCAVANGWTYGTGNTAGDEWQDAYGAAFSAFGAAIDRANALFDNPLATDAEDAQGDVFAAAQQAFAPFIGLDRELRARGNPTGFPQSCLPDYPSVPQPKQADWSLDAFKALTAITDVTDSGAKAVADFFNNPGVMLATGAVVVGGLVLLVLLVRR